MGALSAAERLAYATAKSLVDRGEPVGPNVSDVLLGVLERLDKAGVQPQPQRLYVADLTGHPDMQQDDHGGGMPAPTAVLVTLWADDVDDPASVGEVAFRVSDRWGLPVELTVAP